MIEANVTDHDIKKAIDFYMVANDLKYQMDDKESIADHIYGACVLATAINSEYHLTPNPAEIIRSIVLGKMYEYGYERMQPCLLIDARKRRKYIHEIYAYQYKADQAGHIAHECMDLEVKLTTFFSQIDKDKYDPNDYNKLYELANEQGVLDCLPKSEKNREIFRFYMINGILKTKQRSGWDSTHWNIKCNRIERISEHVVGTIALAIALDFALDLNVNLNKVIETLASHEIGEIFIGDITPFDGVSPSSKQELEQAAMKQVLGNLSDHDKLLNLLYEFDDKQTAESRYANCCDKLEADIQSKFYQEQGYHHPLTEQENNVVFKSPKVQAMLKNGAQTAFDIWYEWDKSIYEQEPVFTKTLNYVKHNKLKK